MIFAEGVGGYRTVRNGLSAEFASASGSAKAGMAAAAAINAAINTARICSFERSDTVGLGHRIDDIAYCVCQRSKV